jgi:hypothetical protein
LVVFGVAVALLLSLASIGQAQSLVAGDISGVIADPSSAVISGATVTLTSLDTGSTQSSSSGSDGTYRFNLLKPGRYELTLERPGFAKLVTDVEVVVGQTTVANLKLELSSQKGETIEVSGIAPLISADPGSSTSFTQKELELLPSGGNDITNIAFTAPGVVVNVTGGYGNFTANGLPATSNLFTVNGENDMDPYFNINNSGATNLTLGQNEIQEATVTTNPYAGEYGQLIGSQVSYVTKSGSNQFHGNAVYSWNGSSMNANNFFSNATDSPRPFANANQWAASVGGPIFKDKTFFFFDTEGLRFVLPNVDQVTVPTPEFSAAVLANIQANQPNQVQGYQTMLGIWANVKGGTPSPTVFSSCNPSDLNLPGFTPNAAGDNCAQTVVSTPTAFAKEWIIAGRVDQKLTSNDNLFFRYKVDHGLQPSAIDAFDPRFDANSNQPSWDAQANETHIFGSHATNAFTASISHYVAQFTQNSSLVNSIFPYATTFLDPVGFSAVNGSGEAFPQGRNITQYQFIDDFSLNRGKHNLKFGLNFRRYDVSDHNFFYNTPLVYFRNVGTLADPSANGLQSFADGLAFQYRRAANLSSDVPIALWGMGFYAQDEWKVTPRLTLTLALRAEHNSNPVCQTNCFDNFTGAFSSLASVQAANGGNDPGDVPYSSDINVGVHQAYKGTDALNLSPRIAFSWSPFAANKTVISGGFGLFYDNPAAGLVDSLLANPPASVALRVRPSTGALAFDSTSTGAAATFQAAASAFDINQSFNQIATTLRAQGVTFTAPAVTTIVGTIHSPQAQEWNLKVQQQVGRNTAITVNYVGNHVIHLPYSNAWPNAFDVQCLFSADFSCANTVPGVSEDGPVVPNYGTVTEIRSGAVSNYHGVNLTVREQFASWFLAHFNYTYSHNLDEVSNGGVSPYSLSTFGESILGQINPVSLRASNYGNSDYDIRHSFSADYVLTPKFHFSNKFLSQAVGGWEWSGKIFARSGLPFSVLDGNWDGFTFLNGGSNIFAFPVAGNVQTSCGGGNVNTNSSPVGCLNPAAYIDSASSTFSGFTTWSPQTRNQYRGPHYFDMDMSLFKTFRLKERVSLGVGATAYNVFNHPNFALPDNTFGSGTFGQIFSTVGTPTSPYGNFLGFDSSVRVVQLNAKIVF